MFLSAVCGPFKVRASAVANCMDFFSFSSLQNGLYTITPPSC